MPQDPFAQYAVPASPSGADPFAAYAVNAGPRKPAAAEDYLPKPTSFLDSATNFVSHFAQTVDPRPMLSALYDLHEGVLGGNVDAAQRTMERVKGIGQAQIDQFKKAKQAYTDGRYSEAVGHTLAGAVPLVGPQAAQAGEAIGSGDVAGGAGTAAGLLAPFAVSAIARSGLKVPGVGVSKEPGVARAVAAGQEAGIPIDAATATGNPFVQAAQKVADRSIVGSVIGQRARAAQQAALSTEADRLAGQAHPAPVTAGEAGEAAQQGVRDVVSQQRGVANDAYDKLRAIEADPKNTQTLTLPQAVTTRSGKPITVNMQTPVALPVDLADTKAAMKPTYDKLAAEAQVVPFMSGTGKGRAFVALDRLMNGPDTVPLSVADAALSDLKAMARSANPDLRTAGQGIAARAVSNLHQAVSEAAERAGPDAVDALNEGRIATKAKYAAAQVLQGLEGRQGTKSGETAFAGLTRQGDTAIPQLRQTLAQTPETKPLIARAVLDGVLNSPTAGPDATLSAWRKLGPQTKQALYTPDHVQAIDDFLLLRKKIADNPNPSGSGFMVMQGGEIAALAAGHPVYTITAPMVSALLHSPTAVKLLTQGFRMPAAAVTTGAYVSALSKAIQEAGGPALVPAMATDQSAQGRQ